MSARACSSLKEPKFSGREGRKSAGTLFDCMFDSAGLLPARAGRLHRHWSVKPPRTRHRQLLRHLLLVQTADAAENGGAIQCGPLRHESVMVRTSFAELLLAEGARDDGPASGALAAHCAHAAWPSLPGCGAAVYDTNVTWWPPYVTMRANPKFKAFIAPWGLAGATLGACSPVVDIRRWQPPALRHYLQDFCPVYQAAGAQQHAIIAAAPAERHPMHALSLVTTPGAELEVAGVADVAF